MKTIFLLVLFSILNNRYVFSQERNSNYHSLVAKKNKRIHDFFVGEKIDIKFIEENKIK